MDRINIITIQNPFNRIDREMKTVEFHGENLQFIRELYFPKDLETIVSLNGIVIRDENLEKVTPRNGDFIIFAPILEGGDDKDIGRALAMIALIIVSVILWQPQGVMAGITGLTGAGLTVGMGLTMMAGGLLINALMPPVAPDLGDIGYSDSTSQTYGWNPKTTQQQGVCIPKVYGLNKVHGNIISTYIDNTQPPKKYLNTLLCLGIGPVNRIYDYKINNQSYETFTGIEVFSRLGLLTQTVIPNFDDTKTEYSTAPFPHKILFGETYTYTTVGNAFDRLEIEVSYLQGIIAYRDDATWYNFKGKVRVKMKKVGDPTYVTVRDSIQATSTVPTSWNGIWSAGYWQDPSVIYGGVSVGEVWNEIAVGSSNYPDHVDGESVYLTIGQYGIWRWMGTAGAEAVTYGLVSTTTTEVEIKGDGKNPVVKTFIEDIPASAKGQYIISVENLDVGNSTDRVFRSCYLSAVREVVRDDFTYPRMALASLKSLATDQLSGSFDFSCLMEGALVANYISTTTYTGYTITYLNNPAWVCFDVLTQPVIDNQRKIVRWDGINPARLYIQDFIDWADWCNGLVTVTATGAQEKRITFNGVFDAQMNMWEAAWKVCQVGRASLIWRGTDLHVVVDKESDPVQLFTVGNIGIDSFKETFLSLEDRASEIEVDFNNLDKDYERDKLTVINNDIDNPANVVSLQLMGITKPTEAWRAANYRLLCNQHILRTIELDVDIDAIACTVGDVVRVQHDVPTWGYGGRVVAATTTTVVLDKQVSYTAATGEITIRLSDDTVVTRALDGAGSSTYTVTVTSDFTVVPSKYDVYALGETTFYVKDYRIIDLSRTSDLLCHIIAVQYDEDVYNEDDSGASIPDEPYNAFNPYVSITAITLRDDGYVDTSDTIVRTINVGYKIQDNAVFNHADIYYKEEGTLNWLFAGLTRTDRFTIPGVNPLTTYTVKPVGTNNLGLVTPDYMCATAVITIPFLPSSLNLNNVTVGPRESTTAMFHNLETAIDFVTAAGGGTIKLKSGTYQLTKENALLNVGIKFIGEGPADSIIIRNLASAKAFSLTNRTSRYEFSNLTIESQNTVGSGYSSMVYITGTTAAQNSANVTFSNVRFLLQGSDKAIWGINGIGAISINNDCYVNGGYYGFLFTNFSNLTITSADFEGQGYASVWINTSGGRVFITDNRVTDFKYYGMSIFSVNSYEVVIDRNILYSVTDDSTTNTNELYGISISGSNVKARKNEVNILATTNFDSYVWGITVGSGNVQVNDNTVLITVTAVSQGDYGIGGISVYENTTCTGNKISVTNGNATYKHVGIEISGSNNNVAANMITSDNVADKSVGIHLDVGTELNRGLSNSFISVHDYVVDDSLESNDNRINKMVGGTW